MLQGDHGKSSRAPASATRCARPPGCSRTGATATQWPPPGLRGDARGAPGAGVPDGGDRRFKAMSSLLACGYCRWVVNRETNLTSFTNP